MRGTSTLILHRLLPVLLIGAAANLGAASAAEAAETAPALTPYTAPDQSASVGVPQGWDVTNGAHGVIKMSGPHGEDVGLGEGIFVHDGPVGSPASPPMKFSMPASSTLGQKYIMLWQQATVSLGKPDPQLKIISARRIPIASGIAECGVVLGSMVKDNAPRKFETQFCSMRPDSGGVFKLIWNHATIPDGFARQQRATVEAVMHSYRPSPATVKLWIQPLTPQMPAMRMRPMMPGGGGYFGPIGADHAAECMDLGVIREAPEDRLPSYCQ